MEETKQKIIDIVVSVQIGIVTLATLCGIVGGFLTAGIVGMVVYGLGFFIATATGAALLYLLQQISERLGVLVGLQSPRPEPRTTPSPEVNADPLHWSAR